MWWGSLIMVVSNLSLIIVFVIHKLMVLLIKLLVNGMKIFLSCLLKICPNIYLNHGRFYQSNTKFTMYLKKLAHMALETYVEISKSLGQAINKGSLTWTGYEWHRQKSFFVEASVLLLRIFIWLSKTLSDYLVSRISFLSQYKLIILWSSLGKTFRAISRLMFNKGTVAMLMCDHSIRALLALDIEDCMGKNEKPGTGSGNNSKKVPVIICLLKTK